MSYRWSRIPTSHKPADHKRWSKIGRWTLDEATALSFDVEPLSAGTRNMLEFITDAWGREYKFLRELARRAQASGELPEVVAPLEYIRWRKVRASNFPRRLNRCLGKRTSLNPSAKLVQLTAKVWCLCRWSMPWPGAFSNSTPMRSRAECHPRSQALQSRNFAALTKAEDFGGLLGSINDYDGSPVTRFALLLKAYTFTRTGELRAAQWSEIDTAAGIWRIPAERMKMREPHVVPLSTQALGVLSELRALTGYSRWLFPNERSPHKPMSENTVLYALYRMGYHSRATGHGFRASASSLLNELGFDPDVIERQLAHKERNKVRAAYHRAEYLSERRDMMQKWADYADEQAAGSSWRQDKNAR